MIKAAVFDMDGTILNTIGDLTDSLNYALVETGHKGGHPEEMVKLCFGWALNLDMIKALAMAKGFSAKDLELAGNKIPVEDIPATEEEINELMRVFTSYYGSHNQIKTKPYSGIPEVIRTLRKKGIRCAVRLIKTMTMCRSFQKNFSPVFLIFPSEETRKWPLSRIRK